MDTIKVDEIVENTLQNIHRDLCKCLDADVLTLVAPIFSGLDDKIRHEIEFMCENENSDDNCKKLCVVLETSGGYIEVVERIVSVFRMHYEDVIFIIPNYAYSAGTVLALSGDDIMMDYYSVLGPIDPQFPIEGVGSVPGMGYIQKFHEISHKINSAPKDDVASIRAETAFLLKKFDPAKLFHIEQAIEHSKELIKDWLPRYKFKNWTHRETTGEKVTERYKVERAERIASVLGDAEHWHSHGRGISMQELESEKIGLKITDFGAKEELNHIVRHYYGLFSDYMGKIGFGGAIHSSRGIRRVS